MRDKFLMNFPEYDVVSRRYCHYENAFQMALLVNPKLFFIGDVRVSNFKGTPSNDKMIMFVDLQYKESLEWITIGVTHFGLDEEEKLQAVKIVRDLIAVQEYPCMVYGDYNFFDDLNGKDQREILLETCVDLAFPTPRRQQSFELY